LVDHPASAKAQLTLPFEKSAPGRSTSVGFMGLLRGNGARAPKLASTDSSRSARSGSSAAPRPENSSPPDGAGQSLRDNLRAASRAPPPAAQLAPDEQPVGSASSASPPDLGSRTEPIHRLPQLSHAPHGRLGAVSPLSAVPSWRR